MSDFYEDVDAIERMLRQAGIQAKNGRVEAFRALNLAVTGLLELVKKQQQQIVDLNSRVEYGYTYREALKNSHR